MNTLHNAHVHRYFRFKAWVARQQGLHLRAFFMADFARLELGTPLEHQNS